MIDLLRDGEIMGMYRLIGKLLENTSGSGRGILGVLVIDSLAPLSLRSSARRFAFAFVVYLFRCWTTETPFVLPVVVVNYRGLVYTPDTVHVGE